MIYIDLLPISGHSPILLIIYLYIFWSFLKRFGDMETKPPGKRFAIPTEGMMMGRHGCVHGVSPLVPILLLP